MEKNSGAASKFIQLQQLRHGGQPALPTKHSSLAQLLFQGIFSGKAIILYFCLSITVTSLPRIC